MLRKPFLLGDVDVFYMISSSLAARMAFWIEQRAILVASMEASEFQGELYGAIQLVSEKILRSGGVDDVCACCLIRSHQPTLNRDLAMRKSFGR